MQGGGTALTAAGQMSRQRWVALAAGHKPPDSRWASRTSPDPSQQDSSPRRPGGPSDGRSISQTDSDLRVGPNPSNWTCLAPSWLLRCGTNSIHCHPVVPGRDAWVAREVANHPALAAAYLPRLPWVRHELPIAIGSSSSGQHHSARVAAGHLAGHQDAGTPTIKACGPNSPAGGGAPSAIDPAADEPGRPTLDLPALRPMDRYSHLSPHALENLAVCC
jgi:hypothetical protein